MRSIHRSEPKSAPVFFITLDTPELRGMFPCFDGVVIAPRVGDPDQRPTWWFVWDGTFPAYNDEWPTARST